MVRSKVGPDYRQVSSSQLVLIKPAASQTRNVLIEYWFLLNLQQRA